MVDGYDEVLLFDVDGYVLEGLGENFFFVNNGKLYMFDLLLCFDGIMCDMVIMFVKDVGIEVIEKCIMCDEVYMVDEVFFIGMVVEVMLICEFDNCMIGSGVCGLIMEKF